MIGTITSLLIGYWFYQSAKKNAKDPFKWLVLGMVYYYGTRIIWTYLIIRPMMGRSFYNHSILTGALIEISAIVVGVIVAALIHKRYITIQ